MKKESSKACTSHASKFRDDKAKIKANIKKVNKNRTEGRTKRSRLTYSAVFNSTRIQCIYNF